MGAWRLSGFSGSCSLLKMKGSHVNSAALISAIDVHGHDGNYVQTDKSELY